MTKLKLHLVTLVGLAAMAAPCIKAVDVSDISIHGSVSDTESYSDDYNYYGQTADKFDNNVRELTLNGGYRWADGLRLSAQIYASDVDGLSTVQLDFLSLDYSIKSWFGVRLGRNKSTLGLYGDSQDLDQIRTFANLPLGFYPRNTRSLNYTDGVEFYGDIPAAKVGSFDYTFFAGRIENIAGDSLIARSGGGLTQTSGFSIPLAAGLNAIWNTPVDGLRFSVTALVIPHIGDTGTLSTYAFATRPGLTYSSTPVMIDEAYGQGAWDYMFAGKPTSSTIALDEDLASVEYSTGKWVFAAEYKYEPEHVSSTITALGVSNSYSKSIQIDTYVSATYQATKKIGLGAYYGYTNTDNDDANRTPTWQHTQGDLCGVISYAPLSWWLFKVEYHQMDGLALVNDAGDYNPNAPTAGHNWNYLVFKSTISF